MTTPTPTPTQAQIALVDETINGWYNEDREKRALDYDGATSLRAAIAGLLAAQLAEAQTNLRAAKRIECDVCEKRIALNRMVSDLGQKHQQAEAAAASARETALEEAERIARRLMGAPSTRNCWRR